MAAAIARLVKRFSKHDSRKDSQQERMGVHTEPLEARGKLDAVSQQNQRLQAEKEHLTMNVHLLQQKLQEYSLCNGSVSAIGVGSAINSSFVNSDDGQTRVSGSSTSFMSGPWQDTPHSIPDSSAMGCGLDLWSNGLTPQTTCLSASAPHSTCATQPSYTTSRPPLSTHSYRPGQQPPCFTGVHGSSMSGSSGRSYVPNIQSPAPSGSNMGQAVLELLSQLQESGSVLGVACKRGWFEVVQALVESGAEVNEIDQEVGMAPLHVSITHYHKDVVALLLQYGAFPNLVATNGQTPLQMAVTHNQCSIVALLINSGAELDARGITSSSVLHDAAKDGHVEMVRTLLMAGAYLESKDQQGRTPLHSAILAGRAAVVDVLVGVGANIHAKSLRGMSTWDALRLAISEGKCNGEASARIQSLLWASDGVKSRRGSRTSEDAINSRAFRMGGDSP